MDPDLRARAEVSQSREAVRLSYCFKNRIQPFTILEIMSLIPKIDEFLRNKLNLEIHKNKVIIRKYGQGIDFLGYVVLPHYRVLRNKTKKRIFRKILKRKLEMDKNIINNDSLNSSLRSCFGILKHCKGFKLKRSLLKMVNKGGIT